jgi:hypothetical protein
MKNILKYVTVAAGGLMILAGCAKDNVEPKAPVAQTVELSFSGAKPALDNATRTEISGQSVIWSQSGEAIRMTYSYDSDFAIDPASYTEMTNHDPKFYASTGSPTVAPDGSTATFTISGNFQETRTGGEFLFYALYPSSATSNSNFTDATDISVSVENTQHPTTSSFDAKADVMIAKASQTYTSLEAAKEQAIPLVYKRVVTHGHVTLKNLAFQEGETVKSVTITAPEGTLITGQSRMDIVAQTIESKTTTVNTVTLDYGTTGVALTAGNFDVWFCSLPFVVAEGEPLKVEVTSTRGTYTRTITARAEGIRFPVNRHSTLGIDMSSATFVETVVVDPGLEGNYMVIALFESTNTYYAMSSLNTNNATRLNRVEMVGLKTIPESLTTEDPTIVWTIAKDGDSYTLANGGQYLTWTGTVGSTSGGSNNVASMGNSSYTLSIVDSEITGCYYIQPTSDNTRYLSLNNNSSSQYFAFYKNTQFYNLYLVPATVVLVPKIEVEENLLLAYNQESAEITVTLTNDQDVAPTVAYYDGDEGTTSPDWFTADYNTETGKIEIVSTVNEGAERKGRIVVTLTNTLGTATKTIAVTQAAATEGGGGDEPSGSWVLVSDASGVTTGSDYIIVANTTNGDWYYLPSTLSTGSAPNATSIDIVDNNIAITVTETMQWTVTGDNTSGFVFESKSRSGSYLWSSNSNNGVRVSTSGGGTTPTKAWTVANNSLYGQKKGLLLTGSSSRNLTLYNEQDWRNYANGTNFGSDRAIYLFKYVTE